MTPDLPNEIHLALVDFDRTRLPAEQQSLQGEAFQRAVQAHFERQFLGVGGAAQVIVSPERIVLRWGPSSAPMSLASRGIERLKAGDYDRGMALLELALSRNPEDCDALLNLAMTLSDKGRLPEAISLLDRLIASEPSHEHAWVALGVARARSGDTPGALTALRRAVEIDPDDAYARKNLGGLLVEAGGDPGEAMLHLSEAVRRLPDDPQLWFAMARLAERTDQTADADNAYRRVIELNPQGPIAEEAQEGRSRIAQRFFRGHGAGLRPDALAYCQGALEHFKGKTQEQIRQVAFEIALLGMKGLDVNSPAPKYTIRTLPGQFSGMHLVCIQYVGFQLIDPTVDIGFDLSKEYAAARALTDRWTP